MLDMKQPVTALKPGDPDDGDIGRQQRGLMIAALANIRKDLWGYKVPAQSRSGSYLVNLEHGPYCTCPDFEERQQPCKHVYAVEAVLLRERVPDAPPLEPKIVRVEFDRSWPTYNTAQEHEGEHFERLLRSLCDTVPQPEREPGRAGRPTLFLPDVVYSLGLKVYSRLSIRRAMSPLRRAEGDGLMTRKPSRTSSSRYLSDPSLTPLLRELIERSALPLRGIETCFAVDSSGFASTANNRWFDHKHGGTKKKVRWAKLHIICGVQTNIVTAADCTAYESADVRFFDEFVRTTAQNFKVEEVSADKAYLSHKNIRVVDEVGGTPYIPLRKDSKLRQKRQKADPLWERLYHHFTLREANFLAHYHKRSNVETTFSMIKSKFGEVLLSKSGPAQVNETLLRVLCHNVCVVNKAMYQLGVEPDAETGILGQRPTPAARNTLP